MDIRFQYDCAVAAAKGLNVAAEDLDSLALTMLDAVDAGEGGEFILNTVAALAEYSGLISAVERAAGGRLLTTVDLIRGVDESTDEYFRKLGEAI